MGPIVSEPEWLPTQRETKERLAGESYLTKRAKTAGVEHETVDAPEGTRAQ